MKEWAGPTSMVWQLRIRRGILAVKVPPEDPEVPVPHLTSQSRTLVLGIGIRITSGCEIQQELHSSEMMKAYWSVRHSSWGAQEHEHTHKLIHSRLQHRGSSLKSSKHMQRGTKLTRFRVRAGGQGAGKISPLQKPWQASLLLCWALPYPASRCRHVPNLSSC